MSSCPSQLLLEQYMMDATSAPVGEHVSSCVTCAGRLAEMRRLSGEFRRFVYPETARAVLDSVDRPSWIQKILRYLGPPALAAAAAASVLIFVGHGPLDATAPANDYVGTKGAGVVLAVFARTLDGAEPLVDGGRVQPGSALRFEVRAPGEGCRLWLLSVDDLDQVSRLYPASGGAAQHVGGPLPGGVVLDQRTGPERIFAVCSREPIDYQVVERAVRAAGAGGVQAVRAAQGLAGLPAGALQTTLLLEKAR